MSSSPILLLALTLCSLLLLPSSVSAFTKKGVAFGADPSSDAAKCNDIATFNISWYYAWNYVPPCQAGVPGVEFIPMAWSAGSLPIPSLPSGSDWLLGFNEPNYANQANMSPALAASLWPQLMSTGRRLVGPAVADCGEGLGGQCTYSSLEWYREFLGNCTGCRVDAVALHLYFCSDQDMINKITALYELTQRSVWLTEFACNAPSSPSQPSTFAQAILPRLESSQIVQRYSWFISYCAGCGAGDLLYDSLLQNENGQGDLTPVGQVYSALQSTSVVTVTLSHPVYIDVGNLSPSTDGTGIQWLADQAFSIAQSTSLVSSTAAISPVSNFSYVYQTSRQGNQLYTIPVSAFGTYTVSLLFAEPLYTTAGNRTFNIFLQGIQVASAYDIVLTAGAPHTAVSAQYSVTVNASTGLSITVQLTSVTGLALLSGLIVYSIPITPTVPSLYISPPGTAVTDSAGHVWSSGLQYASGGNVATPISNTIQGAPADLQLIYKSNLWGAFTLSIPAPASGPLFVTFLYAETYWSNVGQRVFSLLINGVVVAPRVDIVALAGGSLRAVNVTYRVTVQPTNPYIVVQTVNIVDNGLIAGIIITQ